MVGNREGRVITGFRSGDQILASRPSHIRLNSKMIVPRSHIISYYPSMRVVQLLHGTSTVVDDKYELDLVNFIVDRRNKKE